jgi:hypothetical protein
VTPHLFARRVTSTRPPEEVAEEYQTQLFASAFIIYLQPLRKPPLNWCFVGENMPLQKSFSDQNHSSKVNNNPS